MQLLSVRTSLSHTHRLQVRFSDEDLERLDARAIELGLPLTSTVRTLTRMALAGARDARLDELESVAVAGLMAAEHGLRLLEVLFPNAGQRSAELADATRLCALERVATVRRDLEEAER